MSDDAVERLCELIKGQGGAGAPDPAYNLLQLIRDHRGDIAKVLGVQRTQTGDGQYSLVFGRVACELGRILFVDENSFHDLDVGPNAIVPGGLIIGAVGGAVADFLPELRLRGFTIEFQRPVPIGGTAFLTLKRLPDERHWSVLSAVLRNAEGKPICSPTNIYLQKKKK